MTACRILCLSFLVLQSLALAAVPTGKPRLVRKIELPHPDSLALFSSVNQIGEFVWVASPNQMVILAKNEEHRVVKTHVTGNGEYSVTSRPIGIGDFVYYTVKNDQSSASQLFIVNANPPHDIVKTIPLAKPWDAVHFGNYAALIDQGGKVTLIDRRTHEIAKVLSFDQNLNPGLVVNSKLYVPGSFRDLVIISTKDPERGQPDDPPFRLKTLAVGGTITGNIIFHRGLVYAIVDKKKLVAIDPEAQSVTTLSEFQNAVNVSAIGNHVFVELSRRTLDYSSPHGDVWDDLSAHFAVLNLSTGKVEMLDGPGYFYAPLNALGKHVCLERKIDHDLLTRERNFLCIDPEHSLETAKLFPFYAHSTIQDGHLFHMDWVSEHDIISLLVYGSDLELAREIRFSGNLNSVYEISGRYLYFGQWYFNYGNGGRFIKHLSVYDIFGSLKAEHSDG